MKERNTRMPTHAIDPILLAGEDGYVYGDNHCFSFSAPTGCITDHLSGKSQGLACVCYHADRNWPKATAVIYARVADKAKSPKIRSLKR